MKNLYFPIIITILTLATIVNTHAETHQFSLNLSSDTLQAGEKLPTPKTIGKLQFSNGSIPAYQVYFTAGYSDKDYETTVPKNFKINKPLDKKLQTELVAYSFDGRWMLIPKNWRFVEAGVGADGSRAIAFAPPTGQNGHFTYWTNSGGCVGCALDSASLFFKEADKLNQQEFERKPHYRDSKPTFTATQIRPYTQAYRTTINGQNIDGLAYFNNAQDTYVELVEVSLPKSQVHLATPILNWWIK